MSDVDPDAAAIAAAEAENARRAAQVQAAMVAQGQVTETPVIEDYFGFSETHKVVLPNGQYILHDTLNEGARRKYLNNQNRDITVEKVTGNAKVKVMQGEERHALLTEAITGWDLQSRDRTGVLVPVPFSKTKLNDFLDKAPPTIIDIIEKAVRKANPWLQAAVTSDDIRKSIAEMEEMLEAKLEEEAGKVS